MRSLIITIGLPGSGKTAWARERLAMCPPGVSVRVNRDSLREMAHGGWTGTPEIEDQITAMQRAMIVAAWESGAIEVIVDDTNLVPHHRTSLRTLAYRNSAKFDTVELRDVPLKTCLERNAERTGTARLDDEVILRMHRLWIESGA